MQVLQELGISEERLQSSVVEVWNKADLLAQGAGSGEALAGGSAPASGASSGPSPSPEKGPPPAAAEGAAAAATEAAAAAAERPARGGAAPPQLPPSLAHVRRLLEAHAAAAEVAKAKRGRGRGGPAAPVFDAWEAGRVVRKAALARAAEAGGGGAAGKRRTPAGQLPTAVLTSVKEGAGLPQLLLEMEHKVGNQCAANPALP